MLLAMIKANNRMEASKMTNKRIYER
jgi:hypothetical protein